MRARERGTKDESGHSKKSSGEADRRISVRHAGSDDQNGRILIAVDVPLEDPDQLADDEEPDRILASILAPSDVTRAELSDALTAATGPAIRFRDQHVTDGEIVTDGGTDALGDLTHPRMRGGWLRVACQDCALDVEWWRRPGDEVHPHDRLTDHTVAYEAASEAARTDRDDTEDKA
jgi:hypothetical protein